MHLRIRIFYTNVRKSFSLIKYFLSFALYKCHSGHVAVVTVTQNRASFTSRFDATICLPSQLISFYATFINNFFL